MSPVYTLFVSGMVRIAKPQPWTQKTFFYPPHQKLLAQIRSLVGKHNKDLELRRINTVVL